MTTVNIVFKVKVSYRNICRVLISFSEATEPIDKGWCDTGVVTFPATEHCHCPLTGTYFPSH